MKIKTVVEILTPISASLQQETMKAVPTDVQIK